MPATPGPVNTLNCAGKWWWLSSSIAMSHPTLVMQTTVFSIGATRQLPTCAETIKMLQSFQSHPHSGLLQREISSEVDSHTWFLGSYCRTDQPSPDQFLEDALLSPSCCRVTTVGFHGSAWTTCCSMWRLQLAKPWSEEMFITKVCSSISQLP